MKIFKGKTGLDASWQDDFAPTMVCNKCKGNCRVMFTAIEDETEGKGNFVADLYENIEGKMWVHDAIAVAVYLCENCFEPNIELNQA